MLLIPCSLNISKFLLASFLASCSYPALSILYSRKQLRPVVATNLVSLVVLLPLLIVAVVRFGAMGAAFMWGLYGLTQYVVYQTFGLRGIPKVRILSSMLQDFINPCVTSFAVAGVAGYLLSRVESKIFFVFLLGFGLIVGWFFALLVCKNLLNIVVEKLKWKPKNCL